MSHPLMHRRVQIKRTSRKYPGRVGAILDVIGCGLDLCYRVAIDPLGRAPRRTEYIDADQCRVLPREQGKP